MPRITRKLICPRRTSLASGRARNPHALFSEVRLRNDGQTSWSASVRVYPSQIDAFANLDDEEPPSKGDLQALLRISEDDVKNAIADIIGEPFVPKDWGGEKSDLPTNRLTIDGEPHSAAFIFKGPSLPREMHPADMGKRGDQLVRVFDEPVELVVIQHCNKIANTVVRIAESLAMDVRRPRRYCIMDGADTVRLLKAYRKFKRLSR